MFEEFLNHRCSIYRPEQVETKIKYGIKAAQSEMCKATPDLEDVEPLEVILIDDINISLSDQSVIVPSGKQPLQAGDQWYLLAVNRNKIYYFLDKI